MRWRAVNSTWGGVAGRESSTVTNGLLFGQFERRRTDCRPYVLLLLFGTAEPEQLQDGLQAIVLLLLFGTAETEQLQGGLQAIRTVVTVRHCRN
jgi:hypothetical protein